MNGACRSPAALLGARQRSRGDLRISFPTGDDVGRRVPSDRSMARGSQRGGERPVRELLARPCRGCTSQRYGGVMVDALLAEQQCRSGIAPTRHERSRSSRVETRHSRKQQLRNADATVRLLGSRQPVRSSEMYRLRMQVVRLKISRWTDFAAASNALRVGPPTGMRRVSRDSAALSSQSTRSMQAVSAKLSIGVVELREDIVSRIVAQSLDPILEMTRSRCSQSKCLCERSCAGSSADVLSSRRRDRDYRSG